MFEEVENRNNDEIDPIELAKIKQLITNMFDYKSSLPSTGASNMASALASTASAVSSTATNMAERQRGTLK